MRRDLIDFVVLDAVADDLEDIEHIMSRANHTSVGWRELNHDRDYTRDQIVAALLRLVRDQLVEACAYSESDPVLVPIGLGIWPTGPVDDAWFAITPRGRVVHASWEPETGRL